MVGIFVELPPHLHRLHKSDPKCLHIFFKMSQGSSDTKNDEALDVETQQPLEPPKKKRKREKHSKFVHWDRKNALARCFYRSGDSSVGTLTCAFCNTRYRYSKITGKSVRTDAILRHAKDKHTEEYRLYRAWAKQRTPTLDERRAKLLDLKKQTSIIPSANVNTFMMGTHIFKAALLLGINETFAINKGQDAETIKDILSHAASDSPREIKINSKAFELMVELCTHIY